MRCTRCRKEISGIGKPAVPPVVPALIAIAGSIWGLFNLTLGQDPSNALPNWSPVTGWGVTLGSLGLASVFAWIGLVRRKCPDCGCTRMLDAMEEEGLIASERLAAQKAAVDEALVGLGRKVPVESGTDLRAQVEAELRATHAKETAARDKETADRWAIREKEVREEIEKRLRAEHERQGAEAERYLRKRLEEELTPQIETRLRSEMEKQLRAAAVKEAPSAAAPVEAKPVTPAPSTAAKAIAAATAPAAKSFTPTPVATAKQVTPPPVTAAKAIATAKPVTPTPVTAAKAIATAKPVTPTPVTAAKAIAAAKPVTPAPMTAAQAIAASVVPAAAAKPVTPSPVTMAKAIAAWGGGAPAPASPAVPKTATPSPAIHKTAQPAAPQVKVETAPLAIVASVVRLGGPAASPLAVQAAPDVHERAKRRARVILSDLSMYHREELLKAAGAPDPKKELGTLWRDAVLSYNEVASPEIRSVTNYLEEELDRYLVQLRSA